MSDKPRDGLAGMPTGPELAMRLASIDPQAVPDDQLLDLANAEWRQLAHQQARVWAAFAEMAVRAPSTNLPGNQWWTLERIFENAVDELRAELLLTRRSAGTEVAHAHAVAAVPRIAQALRAGMIDRQRAIVLVEGSWDLTPAQTDALLDEVLPVVATTTATGLADKVRRVAIGLDPAWAKRRYTEAVRERKVVGYLNRDGSATLAGQNLPAEDAAAAGARVDALADAAKRAGASAKIDHLRSEVFLGLLDGRLSGMTHQQIVTELIRLYPKPADAARAADEPTMPAAAPRAAVAERYGSHLRVALGTLLGLDEQAGEIAGWGVVPAAVARRMADRQIHAEWRYAILDDQGRLLFDGITRRRPRTATSGATRKGRNRIGSRGGIVELHVPLDLITDPQVAAEHPQWAAVLADLAGQYVRQQPIAQDPAARFPGRRLRRRTHTFFQRCVFRGCRRPASDCDADHRHEHGRGGQTTEANLQPGCDHDHELKTTRGWRLIRRDRHTFVWISPLGRKHEVTIDPIAPPMPPPMPRQVPIEIDRPELDRLDDLHPPPTYQPLDQRGRPLPAAEPVGTSAIGRDPDPPPF